MSARMLIVGAGAWGTALAIILSQNGQPVTLWGRDPVQMQKLARERRNLRYLPAAKFPETLQVIAALDELHGVDLDCIVVAVPCSGLRETLALLQRHFNLHQTGVCLACKGLAADSLQLNHELVESTAGRVPLAVLSGPSFAAELVAGLPTAVTIAAADPVFAGSLQKRFHSETLRIYTHDDVVGVEIGGALKNVMAIAAGIADGLGFGANTRAALITRGLSEIMRLGVAMGGRQETFMGLAGVGDLVLTCTDDQSRNRRLGLALARGIAPEQACADIGQVVEGVRTAVAAKVLADRHAIELPITEQVLGVLEQRASAQDAVQALLMRHPKSELT